MKAISAVGLSLGLFALCLFVAPPSSAEQNAVKKGAPTAKAPASKPAAPAAKAPAAKAPAAKPVVAKAVVAKADAKAAATATKDAKPDAAVDPNKPNRWWNQWAGSSARNNTPVGKNIPAEFDPGQFDEKTGEWKPGTGKNIKWVSRLGSQSYGNPVVADGKIFVGTNNGAGWLKRYPIDTDLGCLLCFNEADGKFLWQHSSEKLPSGRVNDWPQQGICCAPYIEGKRGWFVSSRGEVVCFDTEGFYDGENDGPFKSEKVQEKDEADVIWVLDMMGQLGTFQHNMCSCSITCTGDILWVNTSNGVDEGHVNIPAPNAPSFLAVDKNTGKVIWSDKSPGLNILHGQWSSPTYAVLGGVPQVMFAGGDGYLYSFRGEATPDGKAELLWKFDANPKESIYILGGRGTRNEIIGTPVVYDGLVYLAVGQDPEHGEGQGHLWCIDPTKRGDVSPELAFDLAKPDKPMPHKRMQAVDPKKNEVARPNPNSALVWHYGEYDQNGDGKIEFEETMHRTCGTVTIKDGFLYISDFSGLFHCLDAKTGKPYWTHDLFAATWGSALIVDGKVYVGDEEGKVNVFKLGPKKVLLSENNMTNSVYSTPVVANNILYIANKTHLFAIEPSADDKEEK